MFECLSWVKVFVSIPFGVNWVFGLIILANNLCFIFCVSEASGCCVNGLKLAFDLYLQWRTVLSFLGVNIKLVG